MARRSATRRGRAAGLLASSRGDWAWIAVFAVALGVLVTRNHFLGKTEIPVLPLGPLTLSPFGLLVALDMLFAYYLVKRWCDVFELEWEKLAPGLVWIAALGLYISHLVSIAFYFPEDLSDPIALIDVRTRISSFGGFFGGGAVAVVYLKRKGLPVWRYGDALVYGFVGGYVFGRLGCFAIHDHPGLPTDSPLGVEILGVVRHDLGFYEMLLMLGLLVALHLQGRRGRPPDGAAIALAITLYVPVRFLLDFLRIDDVRYAGLTPGQWMSLPLFAIGLWAWASVARRRRSS